MAKVTEEFIPFNVANYLDDLDDAAAYQQIAHEESVDDPTAVPRALGVIARSQNMRERARRLRMSHQGLDTALSDQANWPT